MTGERFEMPCGGRTGDAACAAPSFAVIVLAAGTSTGRSRPKQLLPYLGRTLVEHAARTALASGACEVVVVAGEHAPEIRCLLARLPVRVVQNREWAEGISSSIRTGLAGLRSDASAAIIALCDQPTITAAHLRALGERVLTGDTPIVASSYEGVLGAPAAFSQEMFPRLLELNGPAGARHLIRSADVHVQAITFEGANEEVEIADSFGPLLRLHRDDPVVERHGDASGARAPPRWRLIVVLG